MDAMATLISSRYGDRIVLSVEEAAQVVDVVASTIYKLIAEGRFPHFHVGGALRVPVLGLAEWMTDGGAPTGRQEPRRPSPSRRKAPRRPGRRTFEEFSRGLSVAPA